MDEVVLRINIQTGEMSVQEIENGIVSQKNISPESLAACIQQSLSYDIHSGLLPPNVISFAVSENGGQDICLRHPERRADIFYCGSEYKNFPLPRLVFGFQVSAEKRVSGCRIGIVQEERLRPDTPMYRYPFSNVSGFSLCVGSNPLPKCESPHTLASLPYLLLALPNNNDRFNPEDNKPRMEYRTLLEHLKDKDSAYYYSDILIPSGKTLRDFIHQN